MSGLVGLAVGAHDFSQFAASLEIAAEALPDELMLRLRAEGHVLVDKAVSAVDPFSETIPPTIQAIVGDDRIEVEARGVLAGLFEHGNNGGSEGEFHHPVFGHADIVVEQPMHPFLGPAMEEGHDGVIEAAAGALEIAIETAAKF